jgi:hypothetical protein
MRAATIVALAAALGWASAARAQGSNLGQQCIDLMSGRTPAGMNLDDLRSRCERLVRDAQENASAQRNGATVQPGQAQGAPAQGQGVLAAFGEAGRELVGSGRAPAGMGMTTRGGPVRYTLLTNAIGWFSGLGVNAELSRALDDIPRISWVAGARYSSTSATNGTATALGLMGGADWFIIGHNNEGLRIGPRLELALGREDFQGTTTFGRLGFSGELGYNFIASNGITGSLAAGLGMRVAGNNNAEFDGFTGGDFGPYVKLGIGYSW